MHFLVVGVPTHHTTLHNAMYVIAVGRRCCGVEYKYSFRFGWWGHQPIEIIKAA